MDFLNLDSRCVININSTNSSSSSSSLQERRFPSPALVTTGGFRSFAGQAPATLGMVGSRERRDASATACNNTRLNFIQDNYYINTWYYF